MTKKEIIELKIFLKKIILFSVFVGLILVIVMFFVPVEEDNYYLTIVDKHKALETTPQPRILLVGGSNLAFGIDSEKMEHELNLSIVNTGLHMGVGLPYILNDLKPYLKEGDTVIIISEYSQFYDDEDKGFVEPLAAMIGINPLSLLYLTPKSLMEIHLIVVTLFRHKADSVLDGVNSFFLSIIDSKEGEERNEKKDDKNFSYSRQGFNQYGDEVSHWNYTVDYDQNYTTGSYLGNKINYNQIEVLNEFHNYAKKRNISVYLSFSPIDRNEYQKNQTAYNQFYDFLKSNVSIPIIGDIEEFSFPRDFFFDTRDHLNYQGVEIRTEKLIFEIKNQQ
jgi:hypothetical protein